MGNRPSLNKVSVTKFGYVEYNDFCSNDYGGVDAIPVCSPSRTAIRTKETARCMGLTVYYDWKVKADLTDARQRIAKFHDLAAQLPFDELSEIYERGSPDQDSHFTSDDDPFHRGALYLTRTRADGDTESVHVPANHAMYFYARVEGAESVAIGLASHPTWVVHHEDIIERTAEGKEHTRRIGGGDPIEFRTRRNGYYSWHSFCKTQYAGSPKLGGEAHFLKAHLSLIELLDQIKETGVKVRIRDDSKYAKHRNVDRLLENLREWNAIVASFTGLISDALGDAGTIVAPIQQRPDFEHLEAKGMDILKQIATRQRKRKK